MRAIVTPAEMASGGIMPGLVDVQVDDGRVFTDVPYRQLPQLAEHERFECESADGRHLAVWPFSAETLTERLQRQGLR